MGLFNFFSSPERTLAKYEKQLMDKRSQSPDRPVAIEALGKMGTVDSIGVLLKRFSFNIDPSITDQEEKKQVCTLVVETGDKAVEPTIKMLRTSPSIAWPLKILEGLLEEKVVLENLLAMLEEMDTEYERDPVKKNQILAVFEEKTHESAPTILIRFFDDVNETARFHAVGALFHQEEPQKYVEDFLKLFMSEDSVRVRCRILDGLISNEWKIPSEKISDVRDRLPSGYSMDSKGALKRSA